MHLLKSSFVVLIQAWDAKCQWRIDSSGAKHTLNDAGSWLTLCFGPWEDQDAAIKYD